MWEGGIPFSGARGEREVTENSVERGSGCGMLAANPMKHRICLIFTAAVFVAAGSLLAQQDAPQDVAPASAAYQAASKIVIPKVDFRGATVREALEFLRVRAKSLDPDGKGINIIIKFEGLREPAPPPPPRAPGPDGIPGLDVPGAPAAKDDGPVLVTLTLGNIPVTEAVRYVAFLVDGRVRWDEHAVVVIAPEPGKGAPAKEVRPGLKVAPGVNKSVLEKLNATIFPKIDTKEASPREVFDFIAERAKAVSPDGTGVSFIWKGEQPANPPKLTYRADHMPLLEVIRYTAELSGLEVTIDPFAVVLSPLEKP